MLLLQFCLAAFCLIDRISLLLPPINAFLQKNAKNMQPQWFRQLICSINFSKYANTAFFKEKKGIQLRNQQEVFYQNVFLPLLIIHCPRRCILEVFLKIRTANRQRSWSRIRGYGVCCHATIVSGMRGFQKWNGQKRRVFVNTFNFHSVSRIVFVLMASDQNAVFPPIDV